jgi:cytochrome c oxidase cbb3-type subunit 1
MEWFVKAFIRASLVWFALGITTGLAMAAYPAWVIYRPAHAHMMVAGFITMMVFGVGYQLLPRLFGFALHSRRLAEAHWWMANVGLAGMVSGFTATPHVGIRAAWMTTLGGILFATGALAFVFNMWVTFNKADARQRERIVTALSVKGLPTADG